MDEEKILKIFKKTNALIFNSHIIYTSGKHGAVYVNKDAIYPRTKEISKICLIIAKKFLNNKVDVVIAPAIGGVILSQWTAYHLSKLTKREIFSVYAEKDESKNAFIIKRGYDKIIAGKNILVVEDVLNTGNSAKKVIEAVRHLKGKIVGLGVLWNRGKITPQKVGNPPKIFSLISINFDSWNKKDCPLCAKGIPINTNVGKGKHDFKK